MTYQAAAPLPPGVDFNVQEAMKAHQLQHLLRQDFTGPILSQAYVTVPKPMMPWQFLISGAFNAYGETQYYEAEIDIRNIESADDFLLLVNQLNKSFEKAANQVGRPE